MTNNNDLNEIDELEEIHKKERRVLKKILDREIAQERKYVAIRGHMGTIHSGKSEREISVPSYASMHSLEWVAKKNVLMGSEMDFMKNSIDPETGKLKVNEVSAEEMKQRAPDWSRQVPLTAYLVQERFRKFGTILAVASPSWIDDPHHENWGKDGRALVSAVKFEALDSAGNIGLLDLNDTQVYALDGQHRVMGIRGLLDLLEDQLKFKSSDGKEIKILPKETFFSMVRSSSTELRRILDEKINIEYIPAVLIGETREEASRRIRSVFVAINSQAKAPTKGENILLDEADGLSIVARRIAHHPVFVDKDKNSRVNWKDSQLSKSDKVHVTTLMSLREFAKAYVESIEDSYAWEPELSTIAIRPSEDKLGELEGSLREILGYVAKLPTFLDLESGDDLSALREFPSDSSPGARGSLLLRPIGLPIVVRAVAEVVAENKQSVAQVFEKLARFDKDGGFSAHLPGSLFYCVTFDPMKRSMIVTKGNQELASRLLKYLLAGADSETRDNLLEQLVSKRTVDEGKTLWRDFSGATTKIDHAIIHLPPPIKV